MVFSIVIPTVPKHHKFLPSLVKFLGNNRTHIHEILIVSSSTDEKTSNHLRAKLDLLESTISIKTLITVTKQSAGQNRNSGWKAATGTYVMFLDADDWYSAKRAEIIHKVIQETNADLILHNYWKLKPRFFLKFKTKLEKEYWHRSPELIESTWGGVKRNIESERGIKGDTNVIARDRSGNSLPIQHGHVTIRRNIVIRFSDEYGEDGRIVRDALEKGYQVIYIPNKLSIYNQISLDFLLRSTYRHIKHLIKLG